MASGTLLPESLRLNAALDGAPLTVTKITRVGPLTGLAAGQPPVWTFVEFEIEDDQVPVFADELARLLEPGVAWYSDLRTATETFVVFCDLVIRYPRGDPSGRRRAEEHARSIGVPEPQIDWPE